MNGIQLEKKKARVCDELCKYPEYYTALYGDNTDAAQEVLEEIACKNCPLNEFEEEYVMTKEEYQALYKDNAPEITLSDEFILTWIDKIADTLNTLIDSSYELHYGELDKKEEYTQHIEPCMPSTMKEYHIYRGIEKLAEVCGQQLLKIMDATDNYPIKLYFYYKGITFFELRKQADEDEAGAS